MEVRNTWVRKATCPSCCGRPSLCASAVVPPAPRGLPPYVFESYAGLKCWKGKDLLEP